MFKQSKRKIVIAMMTSLIVLLIGALAIIYGFSYFEVLQRNKDMIDVYVEMYSLEHQPGSAENEWHAEGQAIDEKRQNGMSSSGAMYKEELRPSMEVSVFYSVALGEGGKVLATDNHNSSIYSNEELIGFAKEIIEKGKHVGRKSNLLYLVESKDDYILIAFMNNTVVQDSITTLFRYTLLFSGVIIVVLFFFARYWAKRIVAPLEESAKKQKQFISDASHELKTPVAIIATNAELLEKEISGNRWLYNIQFENNRMKALVNQMLELVHSETIFLPKTTIDFTRLVQEMVLLFEPIAYEEGRLVESELAENICVFGNEDRLKQLVEILLDNAFSHGLKKGPICITLRNERNNVILSVKNTGEEIPLDVREKLFERFYRLDQVRNSESCHYGLGLSIAKNIVEQHDGKIDIFCYNGLVDVKVKLLLA